MFSMTPSATAITVLFQVVLTSRVGFVSVRTSINTSVPLYCVLFDSTLTNSHHHWNCQSRQVRRHHHTTHRHHSHFHQSFNLSFIYSQSKPPSETGTHQSTGDGQSSLEFELFICCSRCDDDCFWPFVFLRFLFRFFHKQICTHSAIPAVSFIRATKKLQQHFASGNEICIEENWSAHMSLEY